MTPKKSPEADLQNKRMLFLLVGLVIALGITGLAFSIHSKPEAGEYTPPKRETTEMEQIDNTRQDQMETPPEPQKAQAQVVTDALNIGKLRFVGIAYSYFTCYHSSGILLFV